MVRYSEGHAYNLASLTICMVQLYDFVPGPSITASDLAVGLCVSADEPAFYGVQPDGTGFKAAYTRKLTGEKLTHSEFDTREAAAQWVNRQIRLDKDGCALLCY
jgi:hypothetical protein